MTVASKIVAMLNGVMTRAELDAMRPAERRRFAELCRYWARVAELGEPKPKAGVLANLQDGERSQ